MENNKQDKIDKIIFNPKLKKEDLSEDELTLLNETKLISKAVRVNDLDSKVEILKNLESKFSSENNRTNKDSRNVRSLNLSRILSIAASIVLLAGVAFFIQNRSTSSFNPNDYLLHNDYRSSDDIKGNSQTKAYNLFILKEYDKAIPLLVKLTNNPKDTISLYYLCLSYYGYGDYKEYTSLKNRDELIKLKFPK